MKTKLEASEVRMLKKFYQNVGKLFYAVAASDRMVREPEIIKLREIVKSKWLELDEASDQFGVDAAYRIEFEFDWLVAQKLPVKDCFEEFKSFKNEHDDLFTAKIKRLIWETSNDIALALAGKNKSELSVLNKLRILLKD